MKKYFVLAVLFISLLTCVGMAAGEPYPIVQHRSTTRLFQGRAIYNNDLPRFNNLAFYFDEDRAKTETDETETGSLTLHGGKYCYYDAADDYIAVNGEEKTFPLIYASGGTDYVEFQPCLGPTWTFFYDSDGSLQKTPFSWTLFGKSYNGTIPNFRTTSQQLATYVPYVELSSSGKVVNWRMVSPSATDKAVSLAYKSRYRIRVSDSSNNYAGSNWENRDANSTPSGSFTLPSTIDVNKITTIRMDVQISEDPNNPDTRWRYSWFFYNAPESNEGVETSEALKAMKLDVDEVKTITISFKDRFYSWEESSILVSDSSVLQVLGWKYDGLREEGTLSLKGLKKGISTFSIRYGEWDPTTYFLIGNYYTVPTTVTVNSGGSNSDSSGGGCNAGLIGLGAIAMIGFALKRGKK